MLAPIVLFVFNRPEHTRRTVEALARNEIASETDLWIFSDASKTTTQESVDNVKDVREYIDSLKETGFFAGVRISKAEQNRGLANSIIEGVTHVVAHSDRAIVMEDDLVTAPDFLVFMNECLGFFADNRRIGSVTGYSPLCSLPRDYSYSVYQLPRNCSLGWGTWRDRWEEVDWEVKEFENFRRNRRARREFNRCGSDSTDMLFRQVLTDADSWSIRFGFSLFKRKMNTIFPADSRLSHIGWDGSGVHSQSEGTGFNNQISSSPTPFCLSCPPPDSRIIRMARSLYSGPLSARVARWMRCNNLGWIERTLRPLVRSRRDD